MRVMERKQQYFLNGDEDNSSDFLGLSEDHVLVSGWMKSSPTPIIGNEWSDELSAVLISGNRSRSHFESDSTAQNPPPVVGNDATFSSGGHKRKASSYKIGSEKRMKSYEEEESRISEQNSNSTAAAGKGAEVSKSDNNSDAPKTSYIHVRARRGQATDSHSLAERVRREKISERMKFLQDLVPGCNKITGKAGVLDEIINYVQALQRQVEFLSMKLAAHSPRLNFQMGNYPPRDILEMGAHIRNMTAPSPLPATVTNINPEASHISWENPFFHQSFFPGGMMGTENVKIEM